MVAWGSLCPIQRGCGCGLFCAAWRGATTMVDGVEMSLKTLKRRIRSEFWIPLRMLPYALLPDPLNLLVTLPAFLCPTALRRGGRHCWLRRRAGLWATEAVEMSLESLERRIPSEIWVPLRMIPYALQPGELNLLVTLLALLCPTAQRRGGCHCWLRRPAGLWAGEAVEMSLETLKRRIRSEIWVPLRMLPYALLPGPLNLLVTLLAFLCPAALLGLACCFWRRGGRRCWLFRRAGLRATIKAEAVEKSLKRLIRGLCRQVGVLVRMSCDAMLSCPHDCCVAPLTLDGIVALGKQAETSQGRVTERPSCQAEGTKTELERSHRSSDNEPPRDKMA